MKSFYSPPLIDPCEYTVFEELEPFIMSNMLSRLLLLDPPMRSRYLKADDLLLVAIGPA